MMFRTTVDRFNALIHHVGWGFWTRETVHDFLVAEREQLADLGVPTSELLILFDATRLEVQSKEVIDLLRNPENPLYNAKRGAFITKPGLPEMQVKRGNPQAHIRIFDTESEAYHFLVRSYP